MSREERSFTYAGGERRIDSVIASTLGEEVASRSQIVRWIGDGAVSVNGNRVVKPSHKVTDGDCVSIVLPESEPTHLVPFPISLDILYEDEHLLVIDKPSGLSMHPGAGNRSETLANAIVSHVGLDQLSVGQVGRPGIVHRLDKDTTGVVVVAKSSSVHANLARQFAERTTERQYKVLVFTTPRAKRAVQLNPEGEISGAIGRHPSKRTLMAIVSTGKPAVTHWRTVECFQYGCLLECRLETGRTHQIRVHMESIKCPVIGDRVYGDFSNLPSHLRDAADQFGRQALHAAMLGFIHPVTNKKLYFESPLPDDFQALVRTFRME